MYVPKGACAAALRGMAATVSVALVAGTAAACSGSPALSRAAARRVTGDGLARSLRLPVAQTRAPAPAVSVLAGAPDVLTARFARTLFATSPVVVIAAERGTALPAAVKAARAAHAPLLLAPAVTP